MPPKRRKRKQRSSSDLKAGQASADVAGEPKLKAPRIDVKADPADVKAIVRAIHAKSDWREKIRDEKILQRYKEEAATQGANSKSIALAFYQLLQESIDEEVESTLRFPKEEEEDGGYVDDEDFYQGEYEECSQNDRNDVGFIDNLVPESLRSSLEELLDEIANSPNKDFHPGSDGKIQDLIHPSMYPYIRGLSYDKNPSPEELKKTDKKEEEDEEEKEEVEDADTEEKEEDDEEEEEDEDAGYEDMGFDAEREKEYKEKIKKLEGWDSIYQWLPAEYQVSEEGEVAIASYINNLDRERYSKLYHTIERVFECFLPLFERVLGFDPKGKTLQVVTKAANYVLQPKQDYDGSWHVEGMKHEKIVGSGIFYYSTTENLGGSVLAFRELRDNDMYDRERSHNLGFSKNLGKVDTPMGRCLAFQNQLQHKVKLLENKSATEGVRKILCFFIVSPDERIKSSLDIPEQQWDKVKPKVALALCCVLKRMKIEFPPELIKIILEFAKWGFSLDEAKAHRLELMKERKYYVDTNNRVWERSYSFCEH